MQESNIIGLVLDELYRCFDILNTKYYVNKLISPMITIQKSSATNLGHFTTKKIWVDKNDTDNETVAKYEININPLNLNRDIHQIICTLQHELVHYANTVSEVNDCNGKIHNKKFKELAESVGLICEKSKQYGWGTTTCSEEFHQFITDVIKPNTSVFEYFMRLPEKETNEKSKGEKKTFKYTCPSCGTEVKGKKDKHIICGDCDCIMIIEDSE